MAGFGFVLGASLVLQAGAVVSGAGTAYMFPCWGFRIELKTVGLGLAIPVVLEAAVADTGWAADIDLA